MRHFDLALLRTFTAVAERGSMTSAALLLNLTQGAVSQQMARLEDMVGDQVFHRSSRGLVLSRTGEKLLFRARKLLAMNDDLVEDLAASDLSGTVRLGVCFDLMSAGVASIIRAYALLRPNVDIALVCASSASLERQIAAREVDIAVLQEIPEEARGEVLGVDRLVWVGAAEGGAYAKRPLPLSLVSSDCIFRQPVLAALSDHGTEWRSVFENGGYEATAATVRADLAVSAWLTSAIPLGLEPVADCSDLPGLPSFTISLFRADGALMPAARDLADQIRTSFGVRAHPIDGRLAKGI